VSSRNINKLVGWDLTVFFLAQLGLLKTKVWLKAWHY